MCVSIRMLSTFALLVTVCVGEVHGEVHESFVEPYRKIDLAPAESGVVTEILVKEGDRVQAGQILASLDKEVLVVSRDIAASAAQAVGRRDAAVAEFKLRDERLKKFRELHGRGHASYDELQRAETEAAAARGQFQSTEEQRKIDELEIRKTEAMIERRLVRSPIDGVVTRLHREQGEYVTPVSPTVVTVTQLNLLRVVFNLPQSSAAQLKAGSTVTLRIEDGEEAVPGKIELVAPVIDADSGTVRVKIVIDNAQGNVHAGRRCFLTVGTDELAQDKSEGNMSYVNAVR